jgi:hypothetical protein
LQNARVLSFGCYFDTATVSPDGRQLCFRDSHQNDLVVANLASGELLARVPLKIGGTGSDLAWSSDGSVIGAVVSGGFKFFRASDLAALGFVEAKYPSSVLFHPNGVDVLLGTWLKSFVEDVSSIWNR